MCETMDSLLQIGPTNEHRIEDNKDLVLKIKSNCIFIEYLPSKNCNCSRKINWTTINVLEFPLKIQNVLKLILLKVILQS